MNTLNGHFYNNYFLTYTHGQFTSIKYSFANKPPMIALSLFPRNLVVLVNT